MKIEKKYFIRFLINMKAYSMILSVVVLVTI